MQKQWILFYDVLVQSYKLENSCYLPLFPPGPHRTHAWFVFWKFLAVKFHSKNLFYLVIIQKILLTLSNCAHFLHLQLCLRQWFVMWCHLLPFKVHKDPLPTVQLLPEGFYSTVACTKWWLFCFFNEDEKEVLSTIQVCPHLQGMQTEPEVSSADTPAMTLK